ncbi:MAG TPA: response regulator [Steroidobacteraceae bacterium]|nr:response regulator [Steroidobacteraceae bacterium]
MSEVEKKKRSTPEHAAAKGASREAETSLPNVLLVDDQPARLLTYESILEGVGVNCVRAHSGKEALDKLLKQSYAVILLDVMMPDMDGFETASLIRQHPRFEHTPIIFVTGVQVSEINQLKGYEVGAIDYISIPLVPEILRSKVALLVELYKRRAELERLNRELEIARAALETERNRALESNEDLRREREQRYRAVFEHPTELTVVLEARRDGDGQITDWIYRDANSNALKLLGRSHDQVIGHPLRELWPERADAMAAQCARVLEDRAPYRYEQEVDGRNFLSCLYPIGANTVVATGSDITLRTGALREVERRFRAESAEREWLTAVLNSMTDEVYFTDTQERYTYANPAALREFGNENLSGARVVDVIGRLDVLRTDGSPRPVSEAPPLRALRGEVIRDEEQIVRTPRTGEFRDRLVSSAPVRDASGNIIGSVSVARDVTDRKRIEAALAADLRDTRLLRELGARLVVNEDPRQLYEEILGAAMSIAHADGGTIQLLDERTNVLSFVAIRGIDPALSSQFERVDASSGSPCGLALTRGERSFTVFDDPSLPDPDGSLRAHFEYGFRSAQSTPLISRAGQMLGMFSTHWRLRRELTERELRFLDLLARQAADLIERTQGEAELRQRELELRESDRHKDEFIAVLAHELRNPLVPIRNGIELLKNSRSHPELLDSVRPMMERQIAHMVRLIDDLLDVARISAGKIELQRQRVTLGSVMTSAIEATRTAIENARLELKLEINDADVTLNVDPTRLSQVLSNILQNATKFTPPRGQVRVATRLGAVHGEEKLVISIADTGIGIAADQLPRVFDLFAQSATRVRGHQGGLGIGLAIARRLVEMHGGSIVAHSPGENRGSEFVITLPTARDSRTAEPEVKEARATLDGLDVLIVDDNQDAADSMALLVQLEGGNARVAYSAEPALSAIDAQAPDVVLLDIGMPGIDGYEACRRIRARHGRGITLIAVSGWGQESDKQLATSAGFDAHLTKPADPETLARTISRHTSRARRR